MAAPVSGKSPIPRLHTLMPAFSERTRARVGALLLALAVLAVYLPAGNNEFVPYDDDLYVTGNATVQKGWTSEGVRWALTTFHASNWHPLTWWSHMTDMELFGSDPGWHHRGNVVLHALNSAILFLVLRGMTGAYWRSGFVAALFAVHPLHVESVAWVAERKDVLSTLFFLLAIGAYARYVRRPGVAAYMAVLLAFGMGLMAKPMLVTLPLVLLLLDLWPLNRFGPGEPPAPGGPPPVPVPRASRRILEKIPLAALSAASCVVTFIAQERGDSVGSLEYYSFRIRFENSVVSYVRYLWKTVWPARLSVFYPHPAILGGIPWWEGLLSLSALVSITWAVIRLRRKHPYLAFGWMWYLATLLPVIGLVQVGHQAIADRYTYVPLIGVFVAASWGIPEIVSRAAHRKILLAAAATVTLAALSVATWRQIGYWRNGVELFSHALEVTENNQEARKNLGIALNLRGMKYFSDGRFSEAAADFREALRYQPSDPKVMSNLGAAEGSLGNLDESIRLLQAAVELLPGDADARRNLEVARRLSGKNRGR